MDPLERRGGIPLGAGILLFLLARIVEFALKRKTSIYTADEYGLPVLCPAAAIPAVLSWPSALDAPYSAMALHQELLPYLSVGWPVTLFIPQTVGNMCKAAWRLQWLAELILVLLECNCKPVRVRGAGIKLCKLLTSSQGWRYIMSTFDLTFTLLSGYY